MKIFKKLSWSRDLRRETASQELGSPFLFRVFGIAALFAVLSGASPALAQEKPKDSDIIHPRTAAVSGDAPATSQTKSSDSNYLLVVLAAAAAAAGGFMLWRQRRTPGGIAGRDARKLNVAESRSLGNRQYLVVADYDGKKFLLGVCPGSIQMLAPLDEGEPTPRA